MNEKIEASLYFPPKNKFKAQLFKIIRHQYFDIFIMMFIIANIIALCCEVDDQDPVVLDQIQSSYIVFSIVFILEAVLKLFVLGVVNYFDNHWNSYLLFKQIRLLHRVRLNRGPRFQSDLHFRGRHDHSVPENPQDFKSSPNSETG